MLLIPVENKKILLQIMNINNIFRKLFIKLFTFSPEVKYVRNPKRLYVAVMRFPRPLSLTPSDFRNSFRSSNGSSVSSDSTCNNKHP
jgi:hypothetical protein